MKPLRSLVVSVVLAATAAPLWSADAPAKSGKVNSDLAVPAKRQEAVDKAAHLARTPTPAPVPTDLNNPFNPTGFDAPDPEDARPITNGKSTQAQQPVGPTSDRELLETIGAKIQPTGALVVSGRPPILTFAGAKRVRVGDMIEVTYNEKVYELEVTAIDRTNFTLRYRGEEITRPIAKTTK